MTKNIYDAVDQHLAQNHVQYFTDLSDAEKSLLLERAAKTLKANQPGTGLSLSLSLSLNWMNELRLVNPYENFSKRLSETLDKSVNNDVSRSLLKDNPLETKSDLILNEVCEGIVALLRKWPDQKYKLHAFINQPLPPPIRFVAWHLFLNNNNRSSLFSSLLFSPFVVLVDRQKFLSDLSSNPRQVLSPQDGEIQRQCDVLLRRLPVDYQFVDSRGNQSAMKAILSYHHSLFNNQRDLADAEFFYAIPIVLSHHPPLAKSLFSSLFSLSLSILSFSIRTEKPYEKSLAFLIEMYRTFLDTLPPLIKQIYLNVKLFSLSLSEWMRDSSRVPPTNSTPGWRRFNSISERSIDLSTIISLQFSLPQVSLLFSSLWVAEILCLLDSSSSSNIADPSLLIFLKKCTYPWFKYFFVGLSVGVRVLHLSVCVFRCPVSRSSDVCLGSIFIDEWSSSLRRDSSSGDRCVLAHHSERFLVQMSFGRSFSLSLRLSLLVQLCSSRASWKECWKRRVFRWSLVNYNRWSFDSFFPSGNLVCPNRNLVQWSIPPKDDNGPVSIEITFLKLPIDPNKESTKEKETKSKLPLPTEQWTHISQIRTHFSASKSKLKSISIWILVQKNQL